MAHVRLVEHVSKKCVELVFVLPISLTIPPNTLKQHLTYMFFNPKIGEMFVDETING
jgi:hypothetical protein